VEPRRIMVLPLPVGVTVLSTASRVVPMDVAADMPISSRSARGTHDDAAVLMATAHWWMRHVTMIGAPI
jgi:hypothetical protein